MHVEMSLDNDSGEKSAPSRENATDTQTISGSQVATAFARIESNSQQKAPGRIHALLISTACGDVSGRIIFIGCFCALVYRLAAR